MVYLDHKDDFEWDQFDVTENRHPSPLRLLSTSTMSSSRSPLNPGPMYQRMHMAITDAFKPSTLEIVDESSMHAEHAAMRDNGYLETHFRIKIVSDAFSGKMLVQRHRMVYTLLDDEFTNNGLHALNLVTRTPSEITSKNS